MRGRSRERSHHDQPVFVRLCNLGRESPCWGTDRGPPPSPSNTSLQRGELLHMRQTLSCAFALLKQQSRVSVLLHILKASFVSLAKLRSGRLSRASRRPNSFQPQFLDRRLIKTSPHYSRSLSKPEPGSQYQGHLSPKRRLPCS